jgi:hypothetical protein
VPRPAPSLAPPTDRIDPRSYKYVDAMLPPPGVQGVPWERMKVEEAADRAIRHKGAAFQTIQRFRESVPRGDDETRLAGLYLDFDYKPDPGCAFNDAEKVIVWFGGIGLRSPPRRGRGRSPSRSRASSRRGS